MAAVWSIIRFKVLPNYKIEVTFADGTSGIADLGLLYDYVHNPDRIAGAGNGIGIQPGGSGFDRGCVKTQNARHVEVR
jgi:hypothetical protein